MHDAIVIGAGHNGLVCACYLAKAGRKVLVLERREVVGGAVCTEEILPGYRFDVGSSAHIMFKATPIMDELRLAEFGLRYVEMDPWAYWVHPDTGKSITFHRDIGQTCQSIARVCERDAVAYERFVRHWLELNEGVFETFLKPPTPGRLGWTMMRRALGSSSGRDLWKSQDTVRQLLMPYGQLIDELFSSQELRAALAWLAAQSGPAPTELASGNLLGWNAMLHKIGAWRAIGGSGMLTRALADCLRSMGGEIRTSQEVRRISRDGRRLVVETAESRDETDHVVAACHVQTALLDLLDPALAGPTLRRRTAGLRTGNGFGMVVRHAVEELPRYPGIEVDHRGAAPCHSSLQLLCPDAGYLNRAWQWFQRGRTPPNPAVVAMTFSAIDTTLAPPGKHVLFAWAQYHPYELALKGGARAWKRLAEREADRIWEVVCRHAPNMRGKMIGRYIQTPLDLEEKLGLPRGNVMHLDMSIDQMFCMRPLPELSGYRTPVAGLWLTGASTHPGGGVFGASGRNTAHEILRCS